MYLDFSALRVNLKITDTRNASFVCTRFQSISVQQRLTVNCRCFYFLWDCMLVNLALNRNKDEKVVSKGNEKKWIWNVPQEICSLIFLLVHRIKTKIDTLKLNQRIFSVGQTSVVCSVLCCMRAFLCLRYVKPSNKMQQQCGKTTNALNVARIPRRFALHIRYFNHCFLIAWAFALWHYCWHHGHSQRHSTHTQTKIPSQRNEYKHSQCLSESLIT